MAKPKFLYDNRLLDAVPVASSTAAGDYNVLNVRDWRPYTWWKPTAAPSNITVDSGSAQPRDYMLIYGEAGTYQARGSTDNFGASDVLLGSLTLTETGLGLVTFASVSHRYTRLAIAAGTPAVAICAIGAALESPVFLEGEFNPIDRDVVADTNSNENGHPLGRTVAFESWETSLVLPNVSWTWARNTFLPAWKAHLRSTPFGFAWEADTYAADVKLVRAGDKLSMPHRAGALCDVSFDIMGLA